MGATPATVDSFTPLTDSWLTPAQVADRFQVSTPAVTKALRAGRLPGAKILGQWRVDPRELEAWVDSQRPVPTSRQSSRQDLISEVRRRRNVHSLDP